MADVGRRLRRIEGGRRERAVRLLRARLGGASDEEIALVVAATRRGDQAEANRRLEGIGFTERLLEVAVGSDWPQQHPATVDRVLAEIFRDILSEPRRGRIQLRLAKLARGE